MGFQRSLVYLTPVKKIHRYTFYTTNKALSIVSIKNHTHTLAQYKENAFVFSFTLLKALKALAT
jgi:hypothetical protein